MLKCRHNNVEQMSYCSRVRTMRAWREKIRGNIASGPRTTSSPATSSHVQQVKLLFIALTLTFRLPSSLRHRLQRPLTHPPLCSRCRKKLGGYQPPLDFPIYRAYSVLPGIYSEALTFGLPRRMTLSPTQTLGGPFPSPQVSVRAYTSNVVRFSIYRTDLRVGLVYIFNTPSYFL